MMNEKANRLLADVRAYTVELTNGELTDQDCERLALMVDIFRQIRADGAPDYPIVEYIKRRYGSEKDNDGQTVIYVGFDAISPEDDADFPILDVEEQTEGEDYSDRCPSCNEPFEVQVEDGDDCLECVAGREDPDEYDRDNDWIPWS